MLDACSATPDAALTRLELFALTHEPELLAYARRELTRLGDEVGLQRAAEFDQAR